MPWCKHVEINKIRAVRFFFGSIYLWQNCWVPSTQYRYGCLTLIHYQSGIRWCNLYSCHHHSHGYLSWLIVRNKFIYVPDLDKKVDFVEFSTYNEHWKPIWRLLHLFIILLTTISYLKLALRANIHCYLSIKYLRNWWHLFCPGDTNLSLLFNMMLNDSSVTSFISHIFNSASY